MVIYAEYLFAENLITGIIILLLTSKICGVGFKKIAVLLGGCGCGFFSFMITIELAVLPAILAKLVFSGILVYFVFWPKTWKQFSKLLIVFYIISFALGGITIGLMYFLGEEGVTNNSFVYLSHITYLNIAAGLILSYVCISQLAYFIKDRIAGANHEVEVNIKIGEKSIHVKGIIDSANFLREPISNMPVFLMSKAVSKNILPPILIEISDSLQKTEANQETMNLVNKEKGVRLIPFSSAGGKTGMLLGVKPDTLTLGDKKHERKIEGVYLAINPGEFQCDKNGNCEILLHRDILDKGIGCYV